MMLVGSKPGPMAPGGGGGHQLVLRDLKKKHQCHTAQDHSCETAVEAGRQLMDGCSAL